MPTSSPSSAGSGREPALAVSGSPTAPTLTRPPGLGFTSWPGELANGRLSSRARPPRCRAGSRTPRAPDGKDGPCSRPVPRCRRSARNRSTWTASLRACSCPASIAVSISRFWPVASRWHSSAFSLARARGRAARSSPIRAWLWPSHHTRGFSEATLARGRPLPFGSPYRFCWPLRLQISVPHPKPGPAARRSSERSGRVRRLQRAPKAVWRESDVQWACFEPVAGLGMVC